MEKTYKSPAIVWLKVTDYMHGWLDYELGGAAMVKGQKVLSVQHLEGAREVLREMETDDDLVNQEPLGSAMSATWRNCLESGMRFDPEAIRSTYGITREGLKLFMPIECPPLCLTKNGVVRPWSLDTCFGVRQAAAMQKLLRKTFWDAVADFDREYARLLEGKKYPAVDMIEAFCRSTRTPDLYVETIRREWQRQARHYK